MIRGVGPKPFHAAEGMGAGGGQSTITWRNLLSRGVDLTRAGALKEAQDILAPAFAAGKAAFSKIPLEQVLQLAKVTHDAYFNGADRP